MSTWVVVNLNAAGGTARKVWASLEPHMRATFGSFEVAVTATPDEVAPMLRHALGRGLTRLIGVGGDGTNHALINALIGLSAQDAAQPVAYGMIPVGTGRDWARANGVPLVPAEAVTYLSNAHPTPTDVGVVQYTAPDGATHTRHYLNVASAGLTADVVKRVNRQRARRPWTFLQAALMAIAEYAVREMRVQVDDQTVHEGRVLLAVAANGTTFGHGMRVAPNASPRDGLLDVLLLRDNGRMAALKALQSVYKGAHLTLPSVVSARGREVRLSAADPLDFELDGEYVRGSDLLLTVRPNLLPLLVR